MPGSSSDYKLEWGWNRFLIGEKMFAAICKDASGTRDIITLKLNPLDGDFLRNQYEDIIPGHYMNKTHWNSIYLDGCVPEESLKEFIEKSYHLVLSGLSKKKQNEIL
jgi:predicted DNA-binding protein (MmcQ/YjbR family)